MSDVDRTDDDRLDGNGESDRQDRFDGEFPALLEAVLAGDSWAFERIFRSLAPVVAAYLAAQGSAEPDDLTSEVFVGILRNIHRFEGDEPGFRSWVFTIAHRRLTDERRRHARQPTLEPLTADVVARDDIEEAMERSLASDRVRRLCERLHGDQRNVLLLRLVARLTVLEVATLLDKSPGAVRALQRRGLRNIARTIAREGAQQ